MKTVKEFKDLDGKFVYGDAGSNYKVRDEVAFNSRKIWDDNILESFAWRPLNTLPDNPKFKYEVNTTPHQWRPLLDQPVDIYACDDCYDNSEITIKYVDALKPVNDASVKPIDDKPVFTKEMDDIEYELSLHKANSELLASLTDFMVKNGIGRIGESCIDVAIRELSEKFNIDQRTPKQKAVDEAVLVIEMRHGSAGHAYKKYCGTLYDAGLLKC